MLALFADTLRFTSKNPTAFGGEEIMVQKLIQAGLAALEIRRDNVGCSSYYRDVYPFQYRGRKYVIKEDTWSPDEGSCYEEWKVWQEHSSDPRFRKWFAPVLAAGSLDSRSNVPVEGELNWLIMPWRQILKKVGHCRSREDQIEYLQDKIWPRFREDFPKAKWYCGDRIALEPISCDLHWENWGMTNRGQWQAFDYAGV
jgi:hypothetical protein